MELHCYNELLVEHREASVSEVAMHRWRNLVAHMPSLIGSLKR